MKRTSSIVALMVFVALLAWHFAGTPGVPDSEVPRATSHVRSPVSNLPQLASALPLDAVQEPQPPPTQYGPGDVKQLIHGLVTASDAERAGEIRHQLAGLASRRTARLLIEAYSQVTSDEQRQRLVDTLAKMTVEDALPEIVPLLMNPSFGVTHPLSRAARQVLMRTGTPYAVEVLAARIQSSSAEEQGVYANALSSVSADSAIDELLILAQGRRQECNGTFVRVAAIKALRNFPSSLTRKTFETMTSDPDEMVSDAADLALRMLAK